MTTRGRTRPGGATSYTARLHQRTAAPRPTRRWPAWLTTRPLPALLALSAEVTHLAAAVIEWPTSAPRGLGHVCVAAGLGLLAVSVYFGRAGLELVLGIVLAVAVPAAWPIGALLGLSPYQEYPLLAALSVTTLELVVAGLLTACRLAR